MLEYCVRARVAARSFRFEPTSVAESWIVTVFVDTFTTVRIWPSAASGIVGVDVSVYGPPVTLR